MNLQGGGDGRGNGGFHSYRTRLPHPTSDMRAPAVEMNVHGGSGNNSLFPDDGECTVREQDRFMPIANVIRIMRKILPQHAKISDDAKETIQECVSEYISFITGEANERCQREQRKTITAEDVLWAMSKLGFDDYIEPLTLYLQRYRDYDGGERGSLRGDPLQVMKRGMVDSAAAAGFQPFLQPPPYPLPGHHHASYFGFPVPPVNGYLHRDGEANGAASSLAGGAATVEPPP